MRFAAAAILAFLLQEEPAARLAPREPTDQSWPIAATSKLAAGTELSIVASRLERRWDGKTEQFAEVPSDAFRLRSAAIVGQGGRFEFEFKPGPTGFYQIALREAREEGDRELLRLRQPLGRPAALFRTSKARVKQLVEVLDRASEFLDHIEARVKGGRSPTEKEIKEFQRRVVEQEKRLDDILQDADLTATVALLKPVYFDIRNVQSMTPMPKGGPADNDAAQRKGVFLEPDVTVESLRRIVTLAKKVLGREVRLSIAELLGTQMEASGSDEKKRTKTREAAKEAKALAAEAREPDEKFAKLLDRAERGEEGVAAELLALAKEWKGP